MEPLTVGAALASANHLKNLLSGLTEMIKAAGKAEATAQLIDLQMAMGDVLQRVRDLEDENRKLKAEADLAAKLKYVAPIYILEGHGNADGNYCQVCRDKTGKLSRISLGEYGGRRAWICGVCNSRYYLDKPRLEEMRTVDPDTWGAGVQNLI